VHAYGVVHRDVKPANVLVDNGLTARIGDFGIARSLGRNAGGVTATHVHTVAAQGTCLYMAPEYLKGICSPLVDSFAFGLVVLELLTVRPRGSNRMCSSSFVTTHWVMATWAVRC
jgi:eukaryotic-like serine/threonine-protein kinase